jgi:hypothetical protein
LSLDYNRPLSGFSPYGSGALFLITSAVRLLHLVQVCFDCEFPDARATTMIAGTRSYLMEPSRPTPGRTTRAQARLARSDHDGAGIFDDTASRWSSRLVDRQQRRTNDCGFWVSGGSVVLRRGRLLRMIAISKWPSSRPVQPKTGCRCANSSLGPVIGR